MGDILKVVRVRKKSQFDSLDILVSVEKKNRPFSTKYEVVWFPSGETSTKYEYDSEDLNSETFSGTLNSAPITLTKKELVDRLLKNSDSPYIKLKANAYKDKYSRIGPALSFVLSADKYLGIDELEEIITYGFNTSTWTEGDAFINETIKKKELEDKVKYEIIEDPFNKDNVPRIRSFGYDPYYLPNGAKVIVKWIEGDITNSVNKDLILGSGRKYSTNSGEELEESAIDRKNRNVFKKHAEIFSADDKEIFYLDENLKFTKELKWKEYVNVSDAVILSDVLDAWRAAIPGYSLPLGLTQEQQSVTYRRPSGTDYKSPFDPAPAPGVTQSATQSATQSNTGKIPIIVNLPQGVFKPKTDLPDFVLYIGKNAQKSDPFSFVEINQDETSDEYVESLFEGEPESTINEVEDEPIGDIYNDNGFTGGGGSVNAGGDNVVVSNEVNTPTTPTVGGPSPDSKLLYKSSYQGKTNYFLFNASLGLAGHRLKNVITDLEKYLNANGFSGTKLGNNGIMRDLIASTYPDNPARAVASLHGAGLAIDLKFTIPGKKWSGIGDNENLSSDPTLTKAIAKWVASQGDLTWGAEWGGSKPNDGDIKGRGIIEYHHFEIKASKIQDYWKPFEKELKDYGFDYTKLNRTGKGSQMYNLNIALLKSVGITSPV